MSERLQFGDLKPLPCPFCGGTPLAERELRFGPDSDPEGPDAWAYIVRCRSCAGQGPWAKSNLWGAVSKWNWRSPFVLHDRLAQAFHETYERLAPSFGYETRRESAVPWEEVPEPNRRLMEAVCAELLHTQTDAQERVTPEPARILYRNHRGETAWRTILSGRIWFGATEWHPEPQYLLKAWDVEKDAERDFALRDVLRWGEGDAPARTSPALASLAARVLPDGIATPEETKRLAACVLGQVESEGE